MALRYLFATVTNHTHLMLKPNDGFLAPFNHKLCFALARSFRDHHLLLHHRHVVALAFTWVPTRMTGSSHSPRLFRISAAASALPWSPDKDGRTIDPARSDLLDHNSKLAIDSCYSGVFHLASPCIVDQIHDPEKELLDSAIKGMLNVGSAVWC
ncbi:hypothetical protein ACFX12_029370 [Malus domestica]